MQNTPYLEYSILYLDKHRTSITLILYTKNTSTIQHTLPIYKHPYLYITCREKSTNTRVVQREVKKMSPSQKEALGKQLLEEAARESSEAPPLYPYQDTDFVNPFNIAPPAPAPEVSWTVLKLVYKIFFFSSSSSFLIILRHTQTITEKVQENIYISLLQKIWSCFSIFFSSGIVRTI